MSLEGLVSQDPVIISLFLEIHRLPLSGWHTLLGRDRPSSSEPQRKSEIGIASRRYQPLHLLLKSRVYQGRGGATRAVKYYQPRRSDLMFKILIIHDNLYEEKLHK